MTKRRQAQAINGGLQLPQPIIHRIQSFLTAKEAARTATLSKSWRRAWSTRPKLELDLYDVGDTKFDEFSELAKKIIQRYEQLNLNIESFRLRIESPRFNVYTISLANDLITRALKIGAIHLSLQFNPSNRTVVLPQVVFEAENLVGLSVQWCNIDDLGFGRKVRCSKLESLSLCALEISSEMISNIASCCPLIGKLSLWGVSPFNDDGRFDYSDLGDLSLRFPSLKDLTLNFNTWNPRLSVKFDVPSIRKFRFEGNVIPSMSFVSPPREWESDVFITDLGSGLSTLWFRRLNKFLTGLSLSRIYLSLNFIYDKRCEYQVGDIQGLPKPRVENLTINMTWLCAIRCFALFHGLFQICRPKFITVDCKAAFGERTRTDLLCTTLAQGLDDKSMYGLHDLDKVNVHLFDEDVDVWQPLPLKSFLDPSISPKGNKKTRFQLKWKA